MDARIEKTMEALRRNRMEAEYAATPEEAAARVMELIPEGAKVGMGGSETVKALGLLEKVPTKASVLYNPFRAPAEMAEEMHMLGKHADVFLMSSNAVIEDGRLYNVDGNSNRTSALLHGPKKVIVIAGINKLVPDLDSAVLRVKTICAPKNAIRKNVETYCLYKGHCLSIDQGRGCEMGAGCTAPLRMCCNHVLSAWQRVPGRIHVILVGAELGF